MRCHHSGGVRRRGVIVAKNGGWQTSGRWICTLDPGGHGTHRFKKSTTPSNQRDKNGGRAAKQLHICTQTVKQRWIARTSNVATRSKPEETCLGASRQVLTLQGFNSQGQQYCRNLVPEVLLFISQLLSNTLPS